MHSLILLAALAVSVAAQSATAPAPYSSASASALAVNLPSYIYNLTAESNSTRTAVCLSNVHDCATAQCSGGGNVTTNFCNPQTMGWNCVCSGTTLSRLQPPIVPVNSFDCKLRNGACLQACQDPTATPPVKSVSNCQAACNYIIGSTCGTNDQVIPLYQVTSYSDVPKYYANTGAGGVAAGITTKMGRATVLVPASVLLAIVVGGATVLLR